MRGNNLQVEAEAKSRKINSSIDSIVKSRALPEAHDEGGTSGILSPLWRYRRHAFAVTGGHGQEPERRKGAMEGDNRR